MIDWNELWRLLQTAERAAFKLKISYDRREVSARAEFDALIDDRDRLLAMMKAVKAEANAAADQPDALRPCRSPYCECAPGECTHPGCYDARAADQQTTPQPDAAQCPSCEHLTAIPPPFGVGWFCGVCGRTIKAADQQSAKGQD
jgi:hypothetical protein